MFYLRSIRLQSLCPFPCTTCYSEELVYSFLDHVRLLVKLHANPTDPSRCSLKRWLLYYVFPYSPHNLLIPINSYYLNQSFVIRLNIVLSYCIVHLCLANTDRLWALWWWGSSCIFYNSLYKAHHGSALYIADSY